MAFDRIYYFDKNNFRRYLLGEIQTNFNLNIVIDGDKDSMQIDVHSYSREALQPNTIIYHPNDPLQWWVVKKDNVKRNANEQGYYYIHSITLNGAIDLLKNRDLTDCGMNANGYTIDEFFKKLLKLSNFEFEYEISYGNNVDKDKKVDYIKSYENYTLLSAIRDFFNGYNCDVKLGFQTIIQVGYTYITQAIFKIIPRTGNIDLIPIDISEFNDIRESINFDKESYGTTVISNAQNVVSTQAKTFPQVGGVNITGTDYETNAGTAYIKLPSPAWKINWVKAKCPLKIYVFDGTDPESVVGNTPDYITNSKSYYEQDWEKAFDDIKQVIVNQGGRYPYILSLLDTNKEKIKEMFYNCTTTFYNNPSYNPRINFPSNSNNGSIIKENNVPYIPVFDNISSFDVDHRSHQVTLMDKDSSNLLRNKKLTLVWERGSEKIENIGSLIYQDVDSTMYNIHYEGTDLYTLGYHKLTFQVNGFNFYIYVCNRYGSVTTDSYYYINYLVLLKHSAVFQVNYIPMNDLKVKQDNENNNHDIQLYNQNGKLNDSVALSKMVDSYSKEITHPTITRYGDYYNLNDIPKIGQIVMDGNIKYVINNISYNLYPCESNNQNNINYYCECEFTLAEFISTKSIMTSPNTNVRDYGIPQKYNIKRRQVYRDYYEFGFEEESLANQETPYAKLENYLQLGDSSTPKDFDHTALIKITYETEIGTPPSDTWYYQLNSTAYTMAKSVYEIIDFEDNNIIGYDIQNSTTGFIMSDLWSNQYRAVTTPVSYVDDNGKFVGITLQMVGKETLEQAYSQIDTQGESVMLSAHCFINYYMYDLIAQHTSSFTTETYNGSKEYSLGPHQALYQFVYSINADDLGIPSDVAINNTNITEIVDVAVKKDTTLVDDSNYSVSYYAQESTRMIIVSITFTDAYTVLGESGTLNLECKVKYNRAISLADYVINEPTYEKDPIEVPVFEYSLQFGDTKEVEVGDNILKNNVGMLTFYTAVIRPKNTVTPLNASKWFEGLSVSGDSYSDPSGNYDCLVEIANPNYVNFALEDNNKKLRIKFFTNNIIATFYGIEATDTFSLQDIEKGETTKPKSQLVDKDIIIYRHTIKSMTYDSSVVPDIATCDYDTELMYIIHAPQEEQFDDDDLIINVNFYKLK